MHLTITDNLGGQTIVADTADVAEALTPWFTDAPAEITEAIAALATAARRGEWEAVNGLATYLEVTVTR